MPTARSFERNAAAQNNPARSIQRVRPSAIPRPTAQAAATQQQTKTMSGLFDLDMATTTGVRAKTTPEISPALRPHGRRTVDMSSHTASPVARTDGRRTVHDE